ncbi:MAG: hypothetical protein ABIV10_04475 [Gemmatimonadaceae bacterium]
MTKLTMRVGLFGVLAMVIGCSEAATNPLAPPETAGTVVTCDDPSLPCDDKPTDPSLPPADDSYVEENPCAGCSGAPNIQSTRAVVEVDAAGTIRGYARMEAWGNAYSISMSVSGSLLSGRSWSSPTVSDSYASGLLTIGGLSTHLTAISPVASVATGQTCGLTATGFASFRAEIKTLGGYHTWRASSRAEQAPIVYQAPCPNDPLRPVDLPRSTDGGGGRTLQTDQAVCWDRYLVEGDSWTYMYTWCE